MKVIEYDVLIATRRARMLDMLEGRIKMPLGFDMGTWYEPDARCGTIGCAVGNYCCLPGTEGLWLDGDLTPTDGTNLSPFDAIARHFNIPSIKANNVFCPSNFNDPALIAAKFRKAIKVQPKEQP